MDIYEPAEDSYLLQKVVKEDAFGRVLDIGTGSGIQALTAIRNPNIKEVVAIDINERAVERLREEIVEKRLRKIKSIKSDLFENVSGHFSTIIFNPPYLPQDKGIEDPALYGGKKGWEISERFFSQVSKYLFNDGKILFLFSTLTDKDKVEEIIGRNLLEFKELAREKVSFETLFVYEIKKSSLLRELEGKNLQGFQYLTHGKRGMIYTAISDRSKLVKTHFPSKRDLVKVAIKVKLEESKAQGRMENEAKWLKKLNAFNIGPRFIFAGDNYVVYRFVEGEFILDWLQNKKKEEILKVLRDVLLQCRQLDELQVNKEEMHHPFKHVLVNEFGKPVLLDFERCRETTSPQNVTQCIEFICRLCKELTSKNVHFPIEKFRELAKEYKDTYSDQVFENIMVLLEW